MYSSCPLPQLAEVLEISKYRIKHTTSKIIRKCIDGVVFQVLFFTLQGSFDAASNTIKLVKHYHHPVPAELKVVSQLSMRARHGHCKVVR